MKIPKNIAIIKRKTTQCSENKTKQTNISIKKKQLMAPVV